MTPPNVLAKTIEQVTKIMQSPGCRYVMSRLVYALRGAELAQQNNSVRAIGRDGSRAVPDLRC